MATALSVFDEEQANTGTELFDDWLAPAGGGDPPPGDGISPLEKIYSTIDFAYFVGDV